MDRLKKARIQTAVFVVLVVAIVWFLATGSKPANDNATASNYYHGVFRNKRDPNIWGDDTGKQVPAPADAFPYNPDNNGETAMTPGSYKKDGIVGVKPP